MLKIILRRIIYFGRKYDLFKKIFIWRKSGGTHLSKNMVPKVKYGGGSLMFWDGFTAKSPGHSVKLIAP